MRRRLSIFPTAVFRTTYRPNTRTWDHYDSCPSFERPAPRESRQLLVVANASGVVFLDAVLGLFLAGPFPSLRESDAWTARHMVPYDMAPYYRACNYHYAALRNEWDDGGHDDLDLAIPRNVFPTQNVALAAADRLSDRCGGRFKAVPLLKSDSDWTIVRQPRVGDPVSFEIDETTHYAGLIVTVTSRTATARLRWPSGAPGVKRFTKRAHGGWALRGQRGQQGRMLHGVFNSSPRS